MNTVKNYLWKYSSPAHVAVLVAVAIVLFVAGKEVLGEDYTAVYPVAAIVMANIEIIALKTKPDTFSK